MVKQAEINAHEALTKYAILAIYCMQYQARAVYIISALYSLLLSSSCVQGVPFHNPVGFHSLFESTTQNYLQCICTAVYGVGYSPSLFLLYTLDLMLNHIQ